VSKLISVNHWINDVQYSTSDLSTLEIGPKPVQKDITIIIPTLGRDILQKCLYWIAAGASLPAKLIVVDQGNRTEVATWLYELRKFGIELEYVPSNQRGRSAGINRGLEQVRTRFVAITDDDCFVTQKWLEKLVLYLRKNPNSIITGRVLLAGDDEVEFSVVSSETRKVYERPQLRIHPLIGGNVGMSMEIVRKIGFFDEHPCLGSAEDSDYGFRALRIGIPITYEPEVVLHHYHWRNAGQRASRYNDYSRSQGGFYGTHLFRGGWIIPLQALRDLVRGPIRWARGVIKQDKDMIDRGRADTLCLLPGIIAGIRRQGSA
jgi:GT2 family glycosyltransferase